MSLTTTRFPQIFLPQLHLMKHYPHLLRLRLLTLLPQISNCLQTMHSARLPFQMLLRLSLTLLLP
ncbi:TPA: hypothetical protein HMU23_18835 [Escherichia coli]|nr:hypothetical protein [Escherichia coli]HAJ3240047.1 hypothetical protein [Escherichia coli]HAJ5975257.1 hypothetical protein [Escherichia coli]